MKRGTPDHWKMRELARLVKAPVRFGLAWANGTLERLWHYTAKYAPQGDIGKIPDEHIAEACGWPATDATTLVDALVASRWLDRCSSRRLIVHDWHEHCDSAVKKTLDRKGLAFFCPDKVGLTDQKDFPALALAYSHSRSRSDDGNNSEGNPTPPKPEPTPIRTATDMGMRFEKIYERHPKKADRGIAERYLCEAVSAGADIEEIERVHKQYCEIVWASTETRFVLKLAQWILDKGWQYPPKSREPAPQAKRITGDMADLLGI